MVDLQFVDILCGNARPGKETNAVMSGNLATFPKYIYPENTVMYTMCSPGCYHNGSMATPELGHRMYGYTFLDRIVESQECSNCKVVSEAICQ